MPRVPNQQPLVGNEDPSMQKPKNPQDANNEQKENSNNDNENNQNSDKKDDQDQNKKDAQDQNKKHGLDDEDKINKPSFSDRIKNSVANRLGLNKNNKDNENSENSESGEEESPVSQAQNLLSKFATAGKIIHFIAMAAPVLVPVLIALIILALIIGAGTGLGVNSSRFCGSSSNNNYGSYGDELQFVCSMRSPFEASSYSVYGWVGEDRNDHVHAGVDFGLTLGTSVYAVQDGTVVVAGWENGTGYGNVVIIDHGSGYYTRSAHLNKVSVSEGDTVTQGQKIGESGNTGGDYGYHLHFELLTGTYHMDSTSSNALPIINDYFNAGASTEGKTVQVSQDMLDKCKTTSGRSFSGDFTQYDLTEDQLLAIASLCYKEQSSKDGAAAEASLMANRFELYGSDFGTGSTGLYNYVRNGGWFHNSKAIMDQKNAPEEIVSVVKSVLVDGKRTLPEYIDEHDCMDCNAEKYCSNGIKGDICSIKNKDATYTSMADIKNKNNYKQDESILTNAYGAEYTFYSFPTENSDPFGYTTTALSKSKTKPRTASNNCCVKRSVSSSRSDDMSGLPSGITSEIVDAVISAQRGTNIPVSITLSQYIQESGVDGNSDLATDCHALFGVKGKGPAGSCKMWTWEEDTNGNKTHIQADFKKFNNIVESVQDHMEVLQQKCYAEKNLKTIEEWAEALNYKNCTYATDNDYTENILENIRSYNLDRFDGAISSGSCSLGGNGTYKGNIWDYSQSDPAWGSIPYCGGNIADSGCGPTAMAMIVSTFANAEHNPKELAEVASESGYCSTVTWSYFKEAAKKYNLTYKHTTDSNEVLTALNAGNSLVIANVQNDTIDGLNHYWTPGGHYIVLGVHSGNDVWVQDPNKDTSGDYRSNTNGDGVYKFDTQIAPATSGYAIISK